MKIIVLTFVYLLIVLSFVMILKKIESFDDAIISINHENDSLSRMLDIRTDSLRSFQKIYDSLGRVCDHYIEQKKSVITSYNDKLKWVNEMNKNFIKSMDYDNDGIPDNITNGDYNGDGIPDYYKR